MSRGLTITLVASVLVLALGVAGLAAYVFMRPASAPATVQAGTAQPSEKTGDSAEVGAFLQMKNFVTDLSDKERLRYIDVTLALGFTDEKAVEEAKKLEPRIRDVILGQLRARVAADLAGAQGKEKLAETLKPALAELLEGSLKAIYITDMVVQ